MSADGHGQLRDIVAPRLDVLFCGINPGLLAIRSGHHFDGRGNRFWRVLHLAGFTPETLTPDRDASLVRFGYGITAVVGRATAGADELRTADFIAARPAFEAKIARLAPRVVAFLGKAAYAGLSGRHDIAWGRQAATIGSSRVWILPNPSGRNRSFSLEQLVAAYGELQRAVRQDLDTVA